MSKKESNDKVWEEIHDKCDEIYTKIVEKKKRQTKSKKKEVVAATEIK
jgi:hypothetical protein